MNSKCGVQSKRRCECHESCVCIVGFPACGCQKKSVVYETECRHAAVQRGKQDRVDLRVNGHNLKQNEAQSARADLTNKGVKWH